MGKSIALLLFFLGLTFILISIFAIIYGITSAFNEENTTIITIAIEIIMTVLQMIILCFYASYQIDLIGQLLAPIVKIKCLI